MLYVLMLRIYVSFKYCGESILLLIGDSPRCGTVVCVVWACVVLRPNITGVCLIGVGLRLAGVCLAGVCLAGVYLVGVCLAVVCLADIYLAGVLFIFSQLLKRGWRNLCQFPDTDPSRI